MQQLLPALAHLLMHQDREVVSDACWALSYLTDGSTERIQAVIDAGVLPKLISLLGSQEITHMVRRGRETMRLVSLVSTKEGFHCVGVLVVMSCAGVQSLSE